MGKYRDIIKNKANGEDEKPQDDWVYLSDVEDLLNSIETDVNRAIKSAVKTVKDIADDVESEFSEVTDGLY